MQDELLLYGRHVFPQFSIDFNSSESSINDYGFEQHKKVEEFSSSEDENDDMNNKQEYNKNDVFCVNGKKL